MEYMNAIGHLHVFNQLFITHDSISSFLQFLFSKPVLESSNKKEQGMDERKYLLLQIEVFWVFFLIIYSHIHVSLK